jgi:hypothetical protein
MIYGIAFDQAAPLIRRPFKATTKNMDLAIVMGHALLPMWLGDKENLHLEKKVHGSSGCDSK